MGLLSLPVFFFFFPFFLFSSGHVTLSQSFKEPAFAPSIKETLNDTQLTLRRERMAVAV